MKGIELCVTERDSACMKSTKLQVLNTDRHADEEQEKVQEAGPEEGGT